MAEVESLITGAFARELESNRDRFNYLFRIAKQKTPALDSVAFADHLRTVVAPIVEDVARTHPGAVSEVGEAVYESSLELVSRELTRRHPVILEGWSLLQTLAGQLAAQPHRVIGAVTNAVYNLATTTGADTRLWLQIMREVGRQSPDPTILLAAGQVGAWRAGMAHYRTGALEICTGLDSVLVRIALRLPEQVAVDSAIDRLRKDPWADPAITDSRQTPLRVAERVGSFRGFGGLFLRPPRIAFADGQWLITDEEGTWELTADCYGATFHRVSSNIPKRSNSMGDYRIDRNGRVTRGRQAAAFRELAEPVSMASDGHALAVTTLRSHAVFIVT